MKNTILLGVLAFIVVASVIGVGQYVNHITDEIESRSEEAGND